MARAGSKSSGMQLDDLVAQLQTMYGETLVAVVLYGSAASNEQVAGHSDHNVLVIVEALSLTTLQALGQTARAWQDAGNPPPLMLTRREWLTSSDVFPMEYADILERHRVLAGAFPSEGVSVQTADLRLQVEQEALGKLLRLRRAVMTAGTDTARQRELMRDSVSAMLVIFRSVERLHGAVPERDAIAVATSVAARCGFSAAPFAAVLRLLRGEKIPDGEVGTVLAGYLDAAERLVAYLDGYALPAS